MLCFFEQHALGNVSVRRRVWLRLAGLSALAPALPARAAPPRLGVRPARSVIVVFASGGQSQLDIWDPKPHAPREVRGEFSPIATSVPGTFICEHLPRLARLADRYALIRTMSHLDLDHGSAVYLSLTGQYHSRISSNPPPRPTDLPSIMSVYKRLRPEAGTIDQALEINGPAIVAPQDVAPGQFGGSLGGEFDPLILGNVSEQAQGVSALSGLADLSAVRIESRGKLLDSLDRHLRQVESHPRLMQLQGHYHKALALLADPRTRLAFDLSAEPEALRDRYGRHRSGQACLLARRLAQAGVPLITVIWNHHSRGQDRAPQDADACGWDTHNDIFETLKNPLLPRFDQSLSALLEDLESRGMLEETLVICMGEFGRAPLVALEPGFAGSTPGRKHWAAAYSILAAGAGVSRGLLLGKTDRHAAYPASERFGPWDVAATIFAALGVDPADHYSDSLDRPLPVSVGRPITALYAG
jgi:hypothetical protein